MRNVIGLINFYTSPEILPLTEQRPLGSTSFLGRYAFCDFALSNLCNSGISKVGLLVKKHQRSILKHLGSMESWAQNTKIGYQRVLYNEFVKDPALNTDVNNLMQNDWLLYDSYADYVVVVPAHLIINIDLKPYIDEHVRSARSITVIGTKVKDAQTHWKGYSILQEGSEDGKVVPIVNEGQFKGIQTVSLGIYIISRPALLDMIYRYLPSHPTATLRDLIHLGEEAGKISLRVAMYEGFVRSPDTFAQYMEYSFAMLDRKNADAVFLPDRPIYTLTHDTPPAVYGEESNVSNSYVSNGSTVDGTVSHSIIARNVHIEKGAIVRNSVIFSGVCIHEGAVVENALIDKFCIIQRGHVVKGKKTSPFYARQGLIL